MKDIEIGLDWAKLGHYKLRLEKIVAVIWLNHLVEVPPSTHCYRKLPTSQPIYFNIRGNIKESEMIYFFPNV